MKKFRFITTFFGWKHDRKVELGTVRSDLPPVINENKYEDWVEVFQDGQPLFLVRKNLYTHYDPIDLGDE